MRSKPSKEEIEEMLEKGMSATKIAKATGWSPVTILKLFDQYGIDRPPIGRQRGYKVSEETKEKMRRRIE